MRKFTSWLKEVLEPQKSNFDDGKIEEIHTALSDQSVRTVWIHSLEEEIWQLNIKLDHLMESEEEREWKKLSMRRNAILFVMNKILEAKQLLESEREDQEHQNRRAERIADAATVPLDLRQG